MKLIAFIVEAVNTSETSVNIPEDSRIRFVGYLTTMFQVKSSWMVRIWKEAVVICLKELSRQSFRGTE
jgi:hypothetical protein